VAMERQLWYFF